MDKKANNVNKFWLSYRDVVVSSGIAEKTAEWYVHCAQKFAVSIKGKGLRSRSSKDVSITMIYTHVLNKPGLAVKSPLDVL